MAIRLRQTMRRTDPHSFSVLVAWLRIPSKLAESCSGESVRSKTRSGTPKATRKLIPMCNLFAHALGAGAIAITAERQCCCNHKQHQGHRSEGGEQVASLRDGQQGAQ